MNVKKTKSSKKIVLKITMSMTISYKEPSAHQLWEHLKGRFQKKDGTSAILDFQQMVSTRFHNDDTLESQLAAMQVLHSRCTLNDFDLTDWQYATIVLLTLPSTPTYKAIKDYYLNNVEPKKLSPNTIRAWVPEPLYSSAPNVL